MFALAVLLAVHATPARGADFVVDSKGDASDVDPGDGFCKTAGGDCTLRAAVQESEALLGDDTIQFAIDGSIVRTPGDALSSATGELKVDRSSQQGAGTSAGTRTGGPPGVSPDRQFIDSSRSSIKGLLTRDLSETGLFVVESEDRVAGRYVDWDAARLQAVSLSPVEGVTLMVDAFYHSTSTFEFPFAFLGLSLMVLIGLGGAAKVPLLLAGRIRTHWSVVLLDRESALQVYRDPDLGSEVIYNFSPTTESILSTGKMKHVDGTDWIPVHTSRGEGWVDVFHLTEQVDIEEFIDDPRPPKLAGQLAECLRSGGNVGSLIAERGIMLALTGHPTRLAPEQFAHLLEGERLRRLPAVGGVLQAQDDFRIAVTDPFLAAFDATGEVTPDTAHSQTALIPSEVWNFRYLAVGAGSSQPWLVFFEYEKGRPRIVGLGIDE